MPQCFLDEFGIPPQSRKLEAFIFHGEGCTVPVINNCCKKYGFLGKGLVAFETFLLRAIRSHVKHAFR